MSNRDPSDPNVESPANGAYEGVPIKIAEPSNENPPFGIFLDEMDLDAFFGMRDWLQSAVEAKGAKRIGAGIGMGQADIDIEHEGHRYNVSIRPLK